MKKNTGTDTKGIAELLKKLQGSFLRPEKKEEPVSDTGDPEFQERLKSMLDGIPDPKKDKKKAKAGKKHGGQIPSEHSSLSDSSEKSPAPEPFEQAEEAVDMEDGLLPVADIPDLIEKDPDTEAEDFPKRNRQKSKKKASRSKRTEPMSASLPANDAATETTLPEEPEKPEEDVTSPILNANAEPESDSEPFGLMSSDSEPFDLNSSDSEPFGLESSDSGPSPAPQSIAIEREESEKRRKAPSNITLPPPSDAPDFAIRNTDSKGQPIVIKPPASRQNRQDAIVIRPRADQPKREPKPVRAKQSAEPIVIGKRATPERTSPSASTAKGQAKKEKTVPRMTAVPPTDTTFLNRQNAEARRGGATDSNYTRQETERESLPQKPANMPSPPRKSSAQQEKAQTSEQQPEPKRASGRKQSGREEITEELPLEASLTKPTARTRRSRKKATTAPIAGVRPLMDLLRERHGFSEEDISMIFELGYENELGSLIGFENLHALRSEYLQKQNEAEDGKYPNAPGYRGREYTGNGDRDSILTAFSRDRIRITVCAALTVFCSLLLLFTEPELGGALNGLFSVRFLSPVISLVLLLICALLSIRQLIAGAKSLAMLTPTADSILLLTFVPSFLFGALRIGYKEALFPVCFLCSLGFVLASLCNVLNVYTQIRTFQFLSADGKKRVLENTAPRKKKMRRGNRIVKIIDDDAGKTFYRISSARTAVGFFRRFDYSETGTLPTTILTSIAFSFAICSAFTVGVIRQNVFEAFNLGFAVLFAALPFSSVFGYFYSLFRANQCLATVDCALVGEEAVAQLSRECTLIFRDTDLFLAQSAAEVAIRSSDNFKTDLRTATLLLRKLQGPVGKMVPDATDEDLSAVSILRIADAGVEAMVSGRNHVIAGNAAFLKRYGIRVPKESTDRSARRTKNTALLHFAVNGTLRLTFEICYALKPDSADTIFDLADAGAHCAVLSYDPNLNETFLAECGLEGADAVRVVKPGRFEEESVSPTVDTPAVALHRRDLIYPFYAVKGIVDSRRITYRMQAIAALIGAGALTAVFLLGNGGIIGALAVAGYRVFWAIVSALACRNELSRQKLHMDSSSQTDSSKPERTL